MTDSDRTMPALLDGGADIKARDAKDKMPLDMARPGGLCYALLEQMTRKPAGPEP